MFNPQELPDKLREGPFTTFDAQLAGMTPGRLRHARVLRLSRGIRGLDDGTADLWLLARPYSQITGYSAASHATAFAIWDFPGFLPGAQDPGIHITRQSPHTTVRRRGVVGHKTQFFDDEVVCLAGLWITTRTRTWLDCARKMSIDELTVAADHLLRIPRPEFEGREEPYATAEDLAVLLDRHKGTPGIRKARLALQQARIGADSAPETRLRLAVVRAGLPEPELNRPAGLADGVVRAPDLAFQKYRVAAEYEGAVHSDPEQVDRDINREEDYSQAGWIQVRISKRHMMNGARAAVAKIRNALISHGWRPADPTTAR